MRIAPATGAPLGDAAERSHEHRRWEAWTAQLCTGAFQGEWCQPFYMIPLERWNVERKVTSAVKGTMRKGASPHLPSPIGWMALGANAKVPDSLERELQLCTTYRWHVNIQV